MELNEKELRDMNTGLKNFLQRNIEFSLFRLFGLDVKDKDILEIGCGSGYGAVLLSELHPGNYVGIDLMPEQVAEANKLNLANSSFHVHDASELNGFANSSKDIIVIFRILHHIPRWRNTLRECYRVLKQDGTLYVIEPSRVLIKISEFFLRHEHPDESLFSRNEFKHELLVCRFNILKT